MNKIILRDSRETHLNLLPLTYTRPVADLIVGINTIRQKWQMYLPGDYSYDVEEYLREKFPPAEIGPGDLIITSNVSIALQAHPSRCACSCTRPMGSGSCLPVRQKASVGLSGLLLSTVATAFPKSTAVASNISYSVPYFLL